MSETARPHPYRGMPAYRHWLRAGGIGSAAALDPVVAPGFTFTRDDRVAAAGSCFAQNVVRHLTRRGYNVVMTEPPPRVLPEHRRAEFGYGIFPTRSGNIYTALQLRQWLERAYGRFQPEERVWRRDGAFVDPFRPQVAEFHSEHELEVARERHLAAVREMVETMDVFVFTLGLTEAWVDARDGAVFPVAPGVAGGEYDPERHSLAVFTAGQTVKDLRQAFALIRRQNRRVRFVVTVSPVPLMATALDRHVLVSSMHSKAELLVAAHRAAEADPAVDYFPSYEIVTAPHTRGRYFGADCRQVTEAGVEHVMSVFLRHYAQVDEAPAPAARRPWRLPRWRRSERAILAEALCDEDLLAQAD